MISRMFKFHPHPVKSFIFYNNTCIGYTAFQTSQLQKRPLCFKALAPYPTSSNAARTWMSLSSAYVSWTPQIAKKCYQSANIISFLYYRSGPMLILNLALEIIGPLDSNSVFWWCLVPRNFFCSFEKAYERAHDV